VKTAAIVSWSVLAAIVVFILLAGFVQNTSFQAAVSLAALVLVPLAYVAFVSGVVTTILAVVLGRRSKGSNAT